MSEIQANMEDLAKAAGISISDEPNFDEAPLEQATQEPVQESVVEEQIEEPAPQEMQDSSLNSDQLPEEDFDARITSVLSERLGIELNSIDDLSGIINREPEAPSIDERVAKIAEFVEKTGDQQDTVITGTSFILAQISKHHFNPALQNKHGM